MAAPNYRTSTTALVDALKGLFENRTCTEAQAIANATSKPNTIYYTSDTHCIVIGGNIYGRGEQIVASNFAFLPASEPGPGHDPTFQDTTKIYVQPDSSNPGYFKLWWYLQSESTWINGGSFPLGIPLTAEDISYDLTPTPDLGEGDVQSAIEALDGKVEQLSLDTMGKDESGEYWEDELHEVYGYSGLSNNHRIGANYAGTSASGYYIFIFPSSEGDVWKVEKAAGSGRWEGFWKGGTAYSSITAANHLQSWQQASGTFTAPAGTTLFAVVTNTANLQLTNVWKKTTRPVKTPADIQRQLIEGWVPSAINTTDLDVGDIMPYWSVATTAHGVRIDVRKGQVLLLDLVRTGGAVPLVFTDENRVIIEKHESPVYGAFEAPNDGYAYLQKLISHDTDNYLYVMGYGGHAKDIGNLQAQFDAMYQKGVEDGSAMASIVGLGYNIWDYISGAVNLAGFEYGCRYRQDNPSISGDCRDKYKTNSSLVYFPKIDMSGVTSGSSMFYGTPNLILLPPELNFNHQFDCSNMFRAPKLKRVDSLGNLVVSNATNMFYGATALTYVGKVNVTACSGNKLLYMFQGCSALTHIDEVVCGANNNSWGTSATYNIFGNNTTNTSIRYCLFKNIGAASGSGTIWFHRCSNWGVATTAEPDARQSVIDTLITYSFDRVEAGYSAITVQLSPATKALLTDEEIEQITAKGYTIA